MQRLHSDLDRVRHGVVVDSAFGSGESRGADGRRLCGNARRSGYSVSRKAGISARCSTPVTGARPSERGVRTLERPRLDWRKSRWSGGSGCVEVARCGASVLIRDSKDLGGPALALSPTEWNALVRAVHAGEPLPS
ncbi:DUF397 domain-containing protein [Spirillospora sp. NPDC029432]|uniref:DUF397 domain-containing protein n=1 Tax=Spirillospora sp. NPDC029432 TaxID=3154599 RepID=UPI0034528FEB